MEVARVRGRMRGWRRRRGRAGSGLINILINNDDDDGDDHDDHHYH